MKKEPDYKGDVAEIRSMMERSSKFLSLSGWAGIPVGIYALIGSYIAYAYVKFNPTEMAYNVGSAVLLNIVILAAIVLLVSIGSAIFCSYLRAAKRKEAIWNAAARRLLSNMFLPLATGGVLILIFISWGLIGLLAPLTLIFYGLALFNAAHYTFKEVRFLGLAFIGLGLLSSYFIAYSLLLWAVGFGLTHIVYGVYIYLKHER